MCNCFITKTKKKKRQEKFTKQKNLKNEKFPLERFLGFKIFYFLKQFYRFHLYFFPNKKNESKNQKILI